MSATRRNHIDLPTLVYVLGLMVLSLSVVYSASSTVALERWGSSARLMQLHVIKVIISFALIITFMMIDYHRYREKWTRRILICAVIFLIITLVLGGEVKGAARWLRLGGLGFQPSEFAKFALLFHLCTLLAMKGKRVRDFFTGFLPMMVWIGSVTLLVMLQPNFSTAAMILAISMTMLFVGGAKPSHMLLSAAAVLPVLTVYLLGAPYRIKRVLAFIGFSEDTAGKVNYQLWQGIIGFGNGGIFGVGPGESKQRDFFLPESYGDFVFSIVGEEYGLIGTMFMMMLFLLLMVRGFKIAKHARDEFGRLLAVGITVAIAAYALVNAGVTLGLLPTTGLPMPFVSYGGSSMVFASAAIGVLLNISSQTDLHPRVGAPLFSRRQEKQPAPAVGKVY
jgi:cell division protein FtsW